MKLRVDAQPLGQREAVLRQALADLVRRRERVLRRDVVAVGAQPAEVGRAGRAPARATSPRGSAGSGSPRRASARASPRRAPSCPRSSPASTIGRDCGVWPLVAAPCASSARRPRSRSPPAPRRSSGGAGRSSAGSPPAGGRTARAPRARRCGPSGVSPMPTRMPLVNGIRSSCGVADRLQPQRRVLRRRALVGDEVGAQRLEHQPLRRRHLAQPRQVLARQRAEVRVRQDPALQRALAAPHHVGDEVVEARARAASRATPGWWAGSSPVRTSSSLTRAARRAVEQALDLVGLVQVRPVRGERAVLAVADAGPRERQRQVAREGDAAAHRPKPTHRRAKAFRGPPP